MAVRASLAVGPNELDWRGRAPYHPHGRPFRAAQGNAVSIARFHAAIALFQEYAHLFRCPQCREPLAFRGPHAWQMACTNRHTYEVTRGGYIDFRAGAAPSRNRLSQRAEAVGGLYDEGLFDPLIQAIGETVFGYVSGAADQPRTLVETGCGTGHLLPRLGAALRAIGAPPLAQIGVDRSVRSIEEAARQEAQVLWCVADRHKGLPLASHQAGIALNVLARVYPRVLAKAVAPEGLCIVARPMPDHLAELHLALGTRQPQHTEDEAERLARRLAHHFDLFDRRRLTYTVPIGLGLTRLLAEAYRRRQTNRLRLRRILDHGVPEVTIDLLVLCGTRKSPDAT